MTVQFCAFAADEVELSSSATARATLGIAFQPIVDDADLEQTLACRRHCYSMLHFGYGDVRIRERRVRLLRKYHCSAAFILF